MSSVVKRNKMDVMTDTTFADWLRTTRESQGYSKNALANASGVDRSHIFKMEKGQIPEPAEDTRQRLHAVFGTSDDELVDGFTAHRRKRRASVAHLRGWSNDVHAVIVPSLVANAATGRYSRSRKRHAIL